MTCAADVTGGCGSAPIHPAHPGRRGSGPALPPPSGPQPPVAHVHLRPLARAPGGAREDRKHSLRPVRPPTPRPHSLRRTLAVRTRLPLRPAQPPDRAYDPARHPRRPRTGRTQLPGRTVDVRADHQLRTAHQRAGRRAAPVAAPGAPDQRLGHEPGPAQAVRPARRPPTPKPGGAWPSSNSSRTDGAGAP